MRKDLTSTVAELEGTLFPALDDLLSISFVNRDRRAVLNVIDNTDARRWFSIRDVPELDQNIYLPMHKRMFLIPRAGVLITIGMSGDQLILRSFDIEQALQSEDVDYLFVSSDPGRTAVRGDQYSYPIKVKGRKGSVSAQSLQSG